MVKSEPQRSTSANILGRREYSFWLLISFPLPSLFTSERKTSSEREEMAIGNRRAYVTVTFLVSFLLPSSSYSRHEYNIAKERQF
jgi:hypothetical protein